MADYSIFANPAFDPNDYANAIIADEPYHVSLDSKPDTAKATKSNAEPLSKEDISIAISKLTLGIDDVSRQIKTVVSLHYEELLSQAAQAGELTGSLTSVRSGLHDLDNSLDKFKLKIRKPYRNLQANVNRLQNLHQASDVLRRTSRFIVLARRLQSQMAEMDLTSTEDNSQGNNNTGNLGQDVGDDRDRAISRAGLSIAELTTLLRSASESPGGAHIPLESINVVESYLPFVEASRARITSEMKSMVTSGLTSLNHSLLASSLQTAYNLRILPDLIQDLVFELSTSMEDRIQQAFDLNRLSKEVKEPSTSIQGPAIYKSRIVRTEPTNLTAPQWSAAFWSRFELLVEDVADSCTKVYALEKVLALKKDAITQVTFFDEAVKVLESKPSTVFWTSLSRALESHAKDSAKGSTFLQQTLTTGYPKLLRLFQEFFGKIAPHTEIVYTNATQSPEAILLLKAFSTFEAKYLSKSSAKVNEVIGQTFSGIPRVLPTINDATNFVRTLANELDSARFDPLLIGSVAKTAASSLQTIITRADESVARDRLALTLVGPTASPSQVLNASIASFLYHCWVKLGKLREEYPESISSLLKEEIEDVHYAYDKLMEPMMLAVRRELAAIIGRLHRINLDKSIETSGMENTSPYMKELIEKLKFINAELLCQYSIAEAGRAWAMGIVKFVIRTFALHVSIACPLGESGKLLLTGDMTTLEFALNAFLSDGNQTQRGSGLEALGDEYKLLRALRPLLFLDNSQLASPKYTAGLPPLIVLHNIMVRSPIPLPHSLHGWQEIEYVRWVEEHSEEETWTLVEGGLSHWERVSESEDIEQAKEYIELARVVLRNAQNGMK